jgi:hypothetical protein
MAARLLTVSHSPFVQYVCKKCDMCVYHVSKYGFYFLPCCYLTVYLSPSLLTVACLSVCVYLVHSFIHSLSFLSMSSLSH